MGIWETSIIVNVLAVVATVITVFVTLDGVRQLITGKSFFWIRGHND